MNKKNFKIRGMHCASCAQTIEKALKKTDGVSGASVNYATEGCEVSFDNKKIDEGNISKVVEKSGYELVDENYRSAEFKVIGMSSDHCAGVVKDTLEKFEGVRKIDTNFANSYAKFEYDPSLIKLSALKKAVDNAGYEAIVIDDGDDIYEKEKKAKAKSLGKSA
jgi:Cu+-exporting ATPase